MILLLLLLTTATVLAQEKEKKTNLVAGTSITYMPLPEQIDRRTGAETTNHEVTWTLTFGYEFHPAYRLSLDNKLIFYSVPGDPIRTANLIGLTHQFNVFPFFDNIEGFGDFSFSNHRMFFEFSTHVGNFCSCEGELSTLLVPKLYLGGGVGFAIRLSPKIDLDLAFTSHAMVNPVREFIGYTQYVIGIDYYFRPRKKQ